MNLEKMTGLNSAMNTSFAELETIRNDISNNWTKIIEGVELGVTVHVSFKAFRNTMNGYRERL